MKEETNVRLLPTERLLPNPNQPRKHFDSEGLLELAQSIRENGVLQPLLVRRINNSDYYEIVTGERRLRASILANQQLVPCIEIDCTSQQSATLSIIENIQRRELTFFEEAAAIARLSEVFGMTQEEIARRLGKSQSAVSNKLRLLKLPSDVRYFIEKHDLTERHARALLRLSSPKDIWDTLSLIERNHWNVRQTEEHIDRLTDHTVKPKQNVVRIFKDVRIFVNTVNKAIETMRSAGINADAKKTETDDYIEFLVRIPKSAAKTPTLADGRAANKRHEPA